MKKQATHMSFTAERESRGRLPSSGTKGPICVMQLAFWSSGVHFTHLYLPVVGAAELTDNTK